MSAHVHLILYSAKVMNDNISPEIVSQNQFLAFLFHCDHFPVATQFLPLFIIEEKCLSLRFLPLHVWRHGLYPDRLTVLLSYVSVRSFRGVTTCLSQHQEEILWKVEEMEVHLQSGSIRR